MSNKPVITKKGTGKNKTEELKIPDEFLYERDGKYVIKHAYFAKIRKELGIEVIDVQQLITPTGDNFQQHSIKITLNYPDSPFKVKNFTAIGEASRLNTGKIDNGKYTERGDVGGEFRQSTTYARAHDRAMKDALGLDEYYSTAEAQDFNAPGEQYNY